MPSDSHSIVASHQARSTALKYVHLWYAHRGTTVWCVTTPSAPTTKHASYWGRGWPCFEFALANLLKANATATDWPQVLRTAPAFGCAPLCSAWLHRPRWLPSLRAHGLLAVRCRGERRFGRRLSSAPLCHVSRLCHAPGCVRQVLDLGLVGSEQSSFQRPVPEEALAFLDGHAHGDKKYSHDREDRDAIVAPMWRETVFEVFGGLKEYAVAGQGWGAPEVLKLSALFPLCGLLTRLTLQHNPIGDQGYWPPRPGRLCCGEALLWVVVGYGRGSIALVCFAPRGRAPHALHSTHACC